MKGTPITSNTGPITSFFDSLSEDQRRAIVLLNEYTEVRREFGGYGYSPPSIRSEADLNNGVFKQAVAAAKFLREFGFSAGVTASHWKGYIVHVFDRLKPTIPQPSHLCNRAAIAEYVSGHCNRDVLAEYVFDKPIEEIRKPERSREELRQIYTKVLLPQFRTHSSLQSLGLE